MGQYQDKVSKIKYKEKSTHAKFLEIHSGFDLMY